MEAVRLHLKQTAANYHREETLDNKMTYPLPPFSTVIGALHRACGYREYHPMDISIQGSYGALKREVYMDNCFLNTLQNDRGILVKMANPDAVSGAYLKCAEAVKSQGNDFRKGITIRVCDSALLQEYRDLKDKKDEIDLLKKERLNPFLKTIKEQKRELAAQKKQYQGDAVRLKEITQRAKELSDQEKKAAEQMKVYEQENYSRPISYFRTLTKAPKYYEVLTDVELLLHIRASKQVMQDILEHYKDLQCLGRSEDFVEIMDARLVELSRPDDCYDSCFSAYLPSKPVWKESIWVARAERAVARGCFYYLGKNYKIEDGKRIFQKKAVVYTSAYSVDEDCQDDAIWIDHDVMVDGKQTDCIVAFV